MAAFEHIRCSQMPRLKIEEIPEADMEQLKLATMDAVEAFYLNPENRRRFEEWKANGGMEKFKEELLRDLERSKEE